MKKFTGILVPIILIVAFGSGMAYMRRMVYEQSHEPEPEETNAAKTLKAQANTKKATKHPGRTAVVETSKGTIKFVMYEKDVPKTTSHFAKLVESGFYDGSNFHRVEPKFVIQGGRPANPSAPRPKTIELELSEGLTHVEGAVAMARANDPNSADCEFYITLEKHHELDNHYAVFGQVTEGMDVVKKIKQGDKIKSIRLLPAPPVATAHKEGGHDCCGGH